MSNPTIVLKWDKAKIRGIEQNAIKATLHLGFDIANQARRNAPYRTSALANSIRVEENDGEVWVIAGGNYGGKKVDYAAAVEYGHKQTPGRFIPGRWVGDNFIYDRSANGGMVLKKSFVKGSHYMQRAKEAIMTGDYIKKYFGDIL